MKVVLLLSLLAAWVAMTTAQRRCPYRNPNHTMCKYKPRGCPGKRILRSGGVTKQQQEQVVDVHNQLRAWVSGGYEKGLPAASDMRSMTWDDELAVIAQRWADQCTDGHDQNRNVRRYKVGQNVAITWTFNNEDNFYDDPDWPTQIYAWYDEYIKFGFKKSHIEPFQFDAKLGHFTQLVWSASYKVGCGYAYYRHPSRGFTKIYVCNYGPTGNIIGGSMYSVAPEGKCRRGLIQADSYQGLCDEDVYSQQRSASERRLIYDNSPAGNSSAIPGQLLF